MLMVDRDMNASELADKMSVILEGKGVNPPTSRTITDWGRSRTKPRIRYPEHEKALCEALSCTWDELYCPSDRAWNPLMQIASMTQVAG